MDLNSIVGRYTDSPITFDELSDIANGNYDGYNYRMIDQATSAIRGIKRMISCKEVF